MKCVNGTAVTEALQTALPRLFSLPGAAPAVHTCTRGRAQVTCVSQGILQEHDADPHEHARSSCGAGCPCVWPPRRAATQLRLGGREVITLLPNPSTNPPKWISHRLHSCSVKLSRQVLFKIRPQSSTGLNSWLNVQEGVRSLHQNVHHGDTRLTV